jgi:hypothetical protein
MVANHRHRHIHNNLPARLQFHERPSLILLDLQRVLRAVRWRELPGSF